MIVNSSHQHTYNRYSFYNNTCYVCSNVFNRRKNLTSQFIVDKHTNTACYFLFIYLICQHDVVYRRACPPLSGKAAFFK